VQKNSEVLQRQGEAKTLCRPIEGRCVGAYATLKVK